MTCVAEGLGLAEATATERDASATVDFLAGAVDHLDVALDEQRAIGADSNSGLGRGGSLVSV